MTRLCHLIDDTGPGGVARMLDFFQTSPGMSALAEQAVVTTQAGLRPVPRLEADVIVSHIVLSWRNLPFFMALRAKYPNRTLIHVEHHYSAAFVANEVRRHRRFQSMLAASMSLFDRVITISEAQRRWLQDFVGVSDEKMRLIRSCVSVDGFLALPPVTGPVRRIGALGRLHSQKGFDVLIPAFRAATLPSVTLEIFGDGPERGALEYLAAGDPRIVFQGHVADPGEALAAVDAVAMPSRREPYGLVALEAMAAGRPLLVAPNDGLRDHVELGATAVPDLSVAAWAEALERLCAAPAPAHVLVTRERVANAEARCVNDWRGLLAAL